MRYLALLACLLTLACSQGSKTAENDKLAINSLATGKGGLLIVTSPAFAPGGTIPR
jgi:hypothetical protein